MLNIGMILDKEFPVDTRVENEAIYLIKNNFNVNILSYRFSKQKTDVKTFKDIRIHRILISKFLVDKFKPLIGYKFDFYSYFWAKKIRQFVLNYKIDVLHVHDLYMANAAIKVKKEIGIPIVLDLHENYPAAIKSYNWTRGIIRQFIIQPNRWENLEEKYLKNVNKIIVLSNNFKYKLCNKYSFLDSKNISIYPNVPNVKEFESYKIDTSILAKGKRFVLFYFGLVAERRGIFDCIEAVHRLIEKYSNITLLIIGPVDKADQKFFFNKINDVHIKDNIIYYKWKDISHLSSFIYVSDVCLSPLIKNEQHDSGIANKVFQYMLGSKPVIVSDCIPQKELILKENCGLVFHSQDIDDLIEKIEILILNPELRNKLGQNGRNAIINVYNWKNKSKSLLKIYHQFKKV